ncbi:MAG: hypothetical protein SAJ12_04400 [Jaaginema sp. PMC 1079.18]|nr:hypothetical protein [Jaaginema sp. PMC 1080.18]MEC4850231.1 hypothetical protein [Jaaginema sp. PMC 1079.18]MEC4867305.1 hypothetical protein [Jaaginema sp. PMC 1078.18]
MSVFCVERFLSLSMMNGYFGQFVGITSSNSQEFFEVIYVLFPIVLSVVHIYVGKFYWLHKIIPKERWISLGSGVSIAYVFLEILPELTQAQRKIEQTQLAVIRYLESHVYILALLGLSLFYGLELLALRSRRQNRESKQVDTTSLDVFWVHIGAFAIYNFLIGEVFSKIEQRDLLGAFLFFIAIALHFLINDDGLRAHHKNIYDRVGRWLLAGALFLGWVSSQWWELHEAAIASLWAFIAGGIVFNTLKEEIPERQESCFWAFSIGAIGYTILLLLT